MSLRLKCPAKIVGIVYVHGYGIFVFVHTDTLIREPMVSTVTFLASFPD